MSVTSTLYNLFKEITTVIKELSTVIQPKILKLQFRSKLVENILAISIHC